MHRVDMRIEPAACALHAGYTVVDHTGKGASLVGKALLVPRRLT